MDKQGYMASSGQISPYNHGQKPLVLKLNDELELVVATVFGSFFLGQTDGKTWLVQGSIEQEIPFVEEMPAPGISALGVNVFIKNLIDISHSQQPDQDMAPQRFAFPGHSQMVFIENTTPAENRDMEKLRTSWDEVRDLLDVASCSETDIESEGTGCILVRHMQPIIEYENDEKEVDPSGATCFYSIIVPRTPAQGPKIAEPRPTVNF